MRLYRHLANGSASAATVVLAFAAIVACSGGDRSSGVGGDGFKPPPAQGGPCTPGTVRECGIELGRTDKIVDCAKGTQTCGEDRVWTACVANGTTFKSVAPPPSAGSPSPDLHSNAIGGSATVCSDNPCNPYCKTFNDAPDSGITTDSETSIVPGPTISLAMSNVPGGFANKGTLDAQCAGTPGSLAYNQACQFDHRCGIKPDGSTGCVPFVTGEKNSCGGVDITAPPVCVPAGATTYRNLTVCNRGSTDLTSNIQCMGYPGNSPQFPDDNPGAGQVVLRSATTADPTTGAANPITAANPLKAGECRTFKVPNGNFQSSGTMSIMCNPPATATPVTTTLLTVPTLAETTDFADKANALSDTDSTASATTTWKYERAGAIGYPTSASSTQFTSPNDAANAPDGVAARGTLTIVTSTSTAPTAASSPDWTGSAADVANADALRASVPLRKNRTARLQLSGYTAPGATGSVTEVVLTLRSSTTNSAAFSGSQLFLATASGTILASGTMAASSISATMTTVTYTAALGLGVLDAADIPTLRLYVDAKTGDFGPGEETMNLDQARMAFKYTDPAYAQLTTGSYTLSSAVGDLVGLEFTAKARGDVAGGKLYVYAMRGTTVVGNAAFDLGTTYPAAAEGDSVIASAPALLATDLAGGLTIKAQAYPAKSNGWVDIDALGLRPIYRLGTNARNVRFKGFGMSVPPTATAVKLTTLANYKVDSFGLGDWISGTAYSEVAGTTTLISTSTSQNGVMGSLFPDSTFRVYMLGAKDIADPTTIEDPKLYVDLQVGKGPGAMTGSSIGSLDYLSMRLQYTDRVTFTVPECNPSNNWTVNKANPDTPCAPMSVTTYPPWTVSRVFDGTCPVGSKPKWKNMGYTTTTPSGTKVEFRFRAYARDSTGVCPTLAAAIASPPAPLATAQLSPDTQVCSLTAAATATCPVNLTTGLGADVRQDCLQMDAYGVPATTPAPAAPTLLDWRVTYDCMPEE